MGGATVAGKKAAKKKAAAKQSKKKAGSRRASKPKRSIREQRFIDNMIVWGNGAKAARLAGYAGTSCRSQAARLMAKADIRNAVEKGEELMQALTRFDAATVLRELAVLSTTTLADFIDDQGKLKTDLSDVPPELIACIHSIKETTWYENKGTGEDAEQIKHTTCEIKIHDRIRALTQAGRHKLVKAFGDESDGDDSLAERLDEILRARKAASRKGN